MTKKATVTSSACALFIQARSASKGDGNADGHGFSRQADASAALAR